jgi:subtilase family serine protease
VQLVVNDGTVNSAPASAVVTATAVAPPPPAGGANLGIVRFTASEEVHVGENVRLGLVVRNRGQAAGEAPATLVGMQNGVQVYSQTITVAAAAGKTATFAFGPYAPTAAGKIRWTVTLAGATSRAGTATATTKVGGGEHEED